jgi:hypothetical protein
VKDSSSSSSTTAAAAAAAAASSSKSRAAKYAAKGKEDFVSTVRVESLLHLSVQMSSCSLDPYKDEVGCEFKYVHNASYPSMFNALNI